MKRLLTPILIQDGSGPAWLDEESAFYVLSRDGLFLCRNHEFFRSCAPARDFPRELESQEPFLFPRYPKLSRAQFERVVGFFARMAELYHSEAAVFLAWDRSAERLELLVPEQVATVGRTWLGGAYPIGLQYSMPTDLPASKFIVGDIHSHVNLAAFSSATDVHDEDYQAGLHIVVGRIQSEPPDVHVEAVVDGQRFVLDPSAVIAGYESRSPDVPQEWLEKVRVEEESYRSFSSEPSGGGSVIVSKTTNGGWRSDRPSPPEGGLEE